MTTEQIEKLTFYHGTGVAAARAILTSGAHVSLFERIGAFELGREIRQALFRHADIGPNEDGRLHFSFKGPGMEFSSLWVPALRGIDKDGNASTFEYGHFFATLNIAVAYRYALGNPHRSEFILALAESLKVLAHLGDPLPQIVSTRYPEVARLLDHPSSAVVLELHGITRERLLREGGSEEIEVELQLFRDMQEHPGMFVPLSFRILDVTATDVVAVHDLTSWSAEEKMHDGSWSPDLSRVTAARHAPLDWLAKNVPV